MRSVPVSAHLAPSLRDLFGEHPRAARLSPDEEDAPPELFEVADALEVLDVERELAA